MSPAVVQVSVIDRLGRLGARLPTGERQDRFATSAALVLAEYDKGPDGWLPARSPQSSRTPQEGMGEGELRASAEAVVRLAAVACLATFRSRSRSPSTITRRATARGLFDLERIPRANRIGMNDSSPVRRDRGRRSGSEVAQRRGGDVRRSSIGEW
jgi:hypothetical protein